MEEVKKTLLSDFEERYKEFKEYSNFYIPFVEEAKNRLKEREQFFIDNVDNPDKIEDFLIEYASVPTHYANDMERLKERLITTYEVVNIHVEIPQEVKDDMEVILKMKTPMLFKIEAGKPIAIDPTYHEKIRQEIKNQGVVKKTVEILKQASQ